MKMKTLQLPYGESTCSVSIPERNLAGILHAADPVVGIGEDEAIRAALATPIGSAPLRDLVRPGQTVAVVTSDSTRPCPSRALLPPLLEELNAGGVGDEDITIIVALGLHRPAPPQELDALVGREVNRRVRVLNHDPGDTVDVGTTRSGTPVDLYRPLVEADVRVCLGNVEFHWFAGFSGGAKAILPGCASERTVTANHAMMVREEAGAGRLDGNPVREDLEEGAAKIGIDFILNVVVDADHRVTAAVAGDPRAAHRRACELVRSRGAVAIDSRADVVVVSGGGMPSDINLYQAQKSLENAQAAVRRGGAIVWVARCQEGVGHSVFERWVREAESAPAVLERIQREFVLGGHKAAALATAVQQAQVYLVSDLETDLLARLGVRQMSDPQPAVDAALAHMGPEATVLVMPRGGSTVPIAAAG